MDYSFPWRQQNMVLNLFWVFVSYGDGLQQHEPFQYEEIMEHIFMFPVYFGIWNCILNWSSSAQEAKYTLVMIYKPSVDTDQITITIVGVVVFVIIIIIIISLFVSIWFIL